MWLAQATRLDVSISDSRFFSLIGRIRSVAVGVFKQRFNLGLEILLFDRYKRLMLPVPRRSFNLGLEILLFDR